MTPASKRRWFQFSLRTIFVVVTLLGCWLGYQLNWIRQRHAFEARDGVESFTAAGKGMFVAPGLLQFFGEVGRATIVLYFPAAPTPSELKDVELAKRLFPEAETIVRIKSSTKAPTPDQLSVATPMTAMASAAESPTH